MHIQYIQWLHSYWLGWLIALYRLSAWSVLHISCNMGYSGFAWYVCPLPSGHISGKALMPVLQLLHVYSSFVKIKASLTFLISSYIYKKTAEKQNSRQQQKAITLIGFQAYISVTIPWLLSLIFFLYLFKIACFFKVTTRFKLYFWD